MPRLSTPLIHRARALHPLLPLLLRPCRDLPSAHNELRWLREHAIANLKVTLTSSGLIRTSWPQHLHQMCLERARGKPLQYILGSQPFGALEISCRRGVLIPRPETEILTTHLASLLLASLSLPPLRILDLCTGTGCIPLLLSSLLNPHTPHLHLCGVDISPLATKTAAANLSRAIATKHLPPNARGQIAFTNSDIFAPEAAAEQWCRSKWDILICNPPYISPAAFDKTTSRSVRNYEPRSALVPPAASCTHAHFANSRPAEPDPGDTFYPRLLELAERVGAQVLLFEVADMEQAIRVARMVLGKGVGAWKGCEIWRDWPAAAGGKVDGGGDGDEDGEVEAVGIRGKDVRVRGEGNGRAVLAWRGKDGGRMVGRE